MTRLAAGKVRQKFAETVNRVASRRERVIVRRRGKKLAALIPFEDLMLLEELEDRLDLEEVEGDPVRGPKPTVKSPFPGLTPKRNWGFNAWRIRY